ncbi:SEL1-like repeat protein [[Kitasatospora] papulosa]|uniref:SEL1-like repeat protein n=1 Tax=[Kitasatospora] papulosa TaxID=1464011 RepID=UPI0036E2A7EB
MEDALVASRTRLTKIDLAARTGLGRTTVQQAFNKDARLPSPYTVRELSIALKLPLGEMRDLLRTAEGGPTREEDTPGQPIARWDPHDLEVHPAGTSVTGSGRRALPGYVRRRHDEDLAAAVRDAAAGNSRIQVLVGSSSTGKTRACWEAVQPLAERGWWLWHPFDPTRADEAHKQLAHVGPRTVIWLNEAQHYLGDRQHGEHIAAALHTILTTPERGPVLVLGTLWPKYAHDYTAPPKPGVDDPYSRVRELLAGRMVSIPDQFGTAELAAAQDLADQGDALLVDALTRARDSGRITQDLAGAPELLRRYEQPHHAAARALLEAAMDARRLGVDLHIPQAFLTDAALDYLSDDDYDQLGNNNWAEQAYAELAEPVHGKQAPLRRTTPRPSRRPPAPATEARTATPLPAGPVFRLADYLEQHGRTTRRHLCPPASFWNAAHTHLTHPDDLGNLTEAAQTRHRLQWAHHLRQRAADHGDTRALVHLVRMREEAGDQDGAETLARQAATHGDTRALVHLAMMREKAGDQDGAETLARQAATHGDTRALVELAMMRYQDGAETLYRQAITHGDTRAMVHLAMMRREAGDQDGAETLYRQAAALGNPFALPNLVEMREKGRDLDNTKTSDREAADPDDTDALVHLAMMREEAGDQNGAETLARQAATHGDSSALFILAMMRRRAGDQDGAETLARQAADQGDTGALVHLAKVRKKNEDRDGAETLYCEAADHGDTGALVELALMREEAGDRDGAETLYRQAADRGNIDALSSSGAIKFWPYGLDPDGTPTPRWQQSGPCTPEAAAK